MWKNCIEVMILIKMVGFIYFVCFDTGCLNLVGHLGQFVLILFIFEHKHSENNYFVLDEEKVEVCTRIEHMSRVRPRGESVSVFDTVFAGAEKNLKKT